MPEATPDGAGLEAMGRAEEVTATLELKVLAMGRALDEPEPPPGAPPAGELGATETAGAVTVE